MTALQVASKRRSEYEISEHGYHHIAAPDPGVRSFNINVAVRLSTERARHALRES
jgi:hypothetical protein